MTGTFLYYRRIFCRSTINDHIRQAEKGPALRRIGIFQL